MSPPEGQPTTKKEAVDTSRVQAEVVSLLTQAMPRIQELIQNGDSSELALLTNDLILDVVDRVKMHDGSSSEAALRQAFAGYAASCAVDGKASPFHAAGKAILGSVIASASKLLQAEAVKRLNTHKRQHISQHRDLSRTHPAVSVLTSKGQKHIVATIAKHSQASSRMSFQSMGPNEGVLHVESVQLNQDLLLSGAITPEQGACLKAMSELDDLMNSLKGDNQELLRAAIISIKNRYATLFNNPQDPNIARSYQATKQESSALLNDLSQTLTANMRGEVSSFLGAVTAMWQEGIKGLSEKAMRHFMGNDPHTEHNAQAISAYLGNPSIPKGQRFDPEEPLDVPEQMQATSGLTVQEGIVGRVAAQGLAKAQADDPSMQAMLEKMDAAADAYIRQQAEKGGAQGVAAAMLGGGRLQQQALKGANQAVVDFSRRMLQNLRAADYTAQQEAAYNALAIPEGDWGKILNRLFGNELVKPEGTGGGNTALFSIASSPITQLDKPLLACSKETQLAVAFLKSVATKKADFFNKPRSKVDTQVMQIKQCVQQVLTHAMTKKILSPEETLKIKEALSKAAEELKRLNPQDPDLKTLEQLNHPSSNVSTLAKTMRLTHRKKALNPALISALPAPKEGMARYHSREGAKKTHKARVKAMSVNDAIDHMEDVTAEKDDQCLHKMNPKQYRASMGKAFEVGKILNDPYAQMATQVSHKQHWSPMKHTATTQRLAKQFKEDTQDPAKGDTARETIYSLARILMSHGEIKNPIIKRALKQFGGDQHMAARAIAENAKYIPHHQLCDLLTDVGDLSRNAQKYDTNQAPRVLGQKTKTTAAQKEGDATPNLW